MSQAKQAKPFQVSLTTTGSICWFASQSSRRIYVCINGGRLMRDTIKEQIMYGFVVSTKGEDDDDDVS